MLIRTTKVPAPMVNLGLSFLLATYMFYGFVSMPPDLDQPESMVWVYAKGKIANGLSWWSGFLGTGHPASVYRKLLWYMDDSLSSNFTLYTGINVTDTTFYGVDVRLYEPSNMVRNGPAVLFFHGGLWFTGSTDDHDHIPAYLARHLGVIVISVDYRLAPRHPYPAPLEDCVLATKYFLQKSMQFKVDNTRIALVGIEAGGNLAAAVALKLRDTLPELPYPEIQVLINPILQPLDFKTPSYHQNQYDAAFPKSLLVNSWMWYAFGWDGHKRYSYAAMNNDHTSATAKQSKMAAHVDHTLLHRKYLHESYMPNKVDFGDEKIWNDVKTVFSDPYFAPLLANDLTGMPTSYIVTSQYDVVRDDALMYVKRLEKAGIPVTLLHFDKGMHGHVFMPRKTPIVERILSNVTSFLIKKL